MSEMTSDEVKLRAIGRMQLDSSPASLRSISTDFGVPYSKLLKYRKELEQAVIDGNVATLIDADKLLVSRVAEEVKQDLEDIAPAEGVVITAAVDTAIAGIDGYQALNDKMQSTALVLANKISSMAEQATDSKDLLILVESLSKIQLAFFNKQIINLNMLNQPASTSAVSFEGFKKRR